MGALSFLYGAVSYLAFLVSFTYAIGFVGNVLVPKGIDTLPYGSLPEALLVDVLLLGVFAVQHSVMARKGFKQWWTRIVPQTIERSTYVLASSVALGLLLWKWQPIDGSLWSVQQPAARLALQALFWLGWVIALSSTFMINHFDLFGLRQVWRNLLGQPQDGLRFTTPGPYKLVRHPLYVGWLFAFWMTPVMTAAHLLFSIATTAYILLAIKFEERDLVREHGETYEKYRQSVPMLIPSLSKRDSKQSATVIEAAD